MVIPPVTGIGSPPLYLVVTAPDPDKPLQVPTWACDEQTARVAADKLGGVVYKVEQLGDYRTPARPEAAS